MGKKRDATGKKLRYRVPEKDLQVMFSLIFFFARILPRYFFARFWRDIIFLERYFSLGINKFSDVLRAAPMMLAVFSKLPAAGAKVFSFFEKKHLSKNEKMKSPETYEMIKQMG